jgi:predicted small integral membrane protein
MATALQLREEVGARPADPQRGSRVRHLLEMVVAMVVGMMVLGMLTDPVFSLAGLDSYRSRPELDALVMVFNMSVGMTVWMRHRGHGWPGVLKMDGAMFVSLLALFPLLWLGAISADVMFGLAHVVMLPAMYLAMGHRQAHGHI